MKRDTKITIALGLSLATLLIVLDIIGIINLVAY
jgi:hypothetical protein